MKKRNQRINQPGDSEHIAIGRLGEDLAAAYLARQGMRIIDRNWRQPGIEIDIVAIFESTVVFVEVKTRHSTGFGFPSEAVTRRKLQLIRRGAALYLATHRIRYDGIRFDVVSVVLGPRGQHDITHLEGVGI